MKSLAFLLLATCGACVLEARRPPVPKAAPSKAVSVARFRNTEIVPLRPEPPRRPETETLYYDGRVIEPAPEVWLNGVAQ